MKTFVAVGTGAALVVAGVALFSVPASMILVGSALVYWGLMFDTKAKR